eukprot:10165279-Lingulodinium_polyedra.AAC.1
MDGWTDGWICLLTQGSALSRPSCQPLASPGQLPHASLASPGCHAPVDRRAPALLAAPRLRCSRS